MAKIVSRRGKPPAKQVAEVDIELNLEWLDDDHPVTTPLDLSQEEDTAQSEFDFEYYKENWVIQHRHELHYYSPSCPLRVGAMSESLDGSADIWVGTRWISIDVHDLCELLQPKTIDVTINYRTYQMVTK